MFGYKQPSAFQCIDQYPLHIIENLRCVQKVWKLKLYIKTEMNNEKNIYLLQNSPLVIKNTLVSFPWIKVPLKHTLI